MTTNMNANLAKDNKVEIIGRVESIDLIPGNTPKAGDFVRGKLVLKVETPKEMNIPIDFYCGKMAASTGTPRKLYTQLNDLRKGQRIGVVASIDDNKFWDQGRGQLVKTKRLNLTFINDVASNVADKAEFLFSGFVKEPLREIFNTEAESIGFSIKLGQVHYSGTRAKVIEFRVDPNDRAALNYIQSSYTTNKTVKISGELDYNVITETREEPQDFGKPRVTTFQRNIANLIIRSGASVADGVYENEHITSLLAGDSADDKDVEAKAKTQEKSGAAVSNNKPLASTSGTTQTLL